MCMKEADSLHAVKLNVTHVALTMHQPQMMQLLFDKNDNWMSRITQYAVIIQEIRGMSEKQG